MIVTLNEGVLKEELLEDESEEPEHFDNTTERFKSEPAFDVIYHFEKDDKPPLSKVIGHENQKQELLLVIDWFKRSKELKEKGISVPKGVLLFGRPGNGKSLLIKEIIKCVDAPVFIFRGDQSNIVKGIVDELRVDEQYLTEWEKELNDQESAEKQEVTGSETEGTEEHAEGSHTGLGEQADQGTHNPALDQIAV